MGKVMLRAWCFGGGNGSSSHVPKASVHAESVQRIWNKAGKIPVPHRTAVFLLSATGLAVEFSLQGRRSFAHVAGW